MIWKRAEQSDVKIFFISSDSGGTLIYDEGACTARVVAVQNCPTGSSATLLPPATQSICLLEQMFIPLFIGPLRQEVVRNFAQGAPLVKGI